MEFRYSEEILEAFPQVCGGVMITSGVQNPPSPATLQEAYAVQQAATLADIDGPLSELPSLAAWRATFRAFGVNPTKYRSAAEALLRRLTKKGDIPGINTLVDIGNLVSIRYALPVAMFDVRDVAGGLTVHFAKGDERFTELGSGTPIHPEVGEVVFSDESGMVAARRWCWRQSAESASRADTRDLVVTVESQHTDGRTDVEAALADLQELLALYAGGQRKSALLGAEVPLLHVQ